MRLLTLACALLLLAAPARAEPPPGKTRVVVLGVDHSAQLVSRAYRPAVVEAFIAKVKPDALCIERDPARFAEGDLYEFTYEVAEIAVPYARANHVELCPIDWEPPKDDQVLGFGLDLDAPPPVRPAEGFQAFLTFPDASALTRGLFWAEDRTALKDWDDFTAKEQPQQMAELSRRLFLYRTALQARRVQLAARAHPGKTVMVIVGANHEQYIEQALAADPRVELVQAPAIGAPASAEVQAHEAARYDLAALNFNLLGVQSTAGKVDWAWMAQLLDGLERSGPTPETRLLRIRLGRLTGERTPAQALKAYDALLPRVPADAAFTWTGVKDRSRLDSFFDPFGNMTIAQRTRLETARELYALGRPREAAAVHDELSKGLSPAKLGELLAYWDIFVRPKAG